LWRQATFIEETSMTIRARKYKKLKKRNITLTKCYIFDKKALAFIFLNEESCGHKIAVSIAGDNLEIFYGEKDPFEKGHGHCWIRRTNGYIIYHRLPNEQHGWHNFFNEQIIVPNYYYYDCQK